MTIASEVVSYVGEKLGLGENTNLFQLFHRTQYGNAIIDPSTRILDLPKPSRFVLEVAYYLPYNLFNSTCVQLLFQQTVHDLHGGRYFHKDEDYYMTTALCLQQRVQDYAGDKRTLRFESLLERIASREIDDLLPPHLREASKRLYAEAEVLRLYSQLHGYTANECMLSLLELVREWEDYGVTNYYVTVRIRNVCDVKQILPKREDDLVLGICPKGIHIGTIQERIYTSFFPYESLSGWSCSQRSLSFYLFTHPFQTRFGFILDHATDAFSLILHYRELYFV